MRFREKTSLSQGRLIGGLKRGVSHLTKWRTSIPIKGVSMCRELEVAICYRLIEEGS